MVWAYRLCLSYSFLNLLQFFSKTINFCLQSSIFSKYTQDCQINLPLFVSPSKRTCLSVIESVCFSDPLLFQKLCTLVCLDFDVYLHEIIKYSQNKCFITMSGNHYICSSEATSMINSNNYTIVDRNPMTIWYFTISLRTSMWSMILVQVSIGYFIF